MLDYLHKKLWILTAIFYDVVLLDERLLVRYIFFITKNNALTSVNYQEKMEHDV